MAIPIIDSFMTKFKSLLSSGHSAQLFIETKAGKPRISLHVELPQSPPQPVHGHREQTYVRSRNGPSRQRRREKRAAARLATVKANDRENKTVVEETSEVDEQHANYSSEKEDSVDTDDDSASDEDLDDDTVEETPKSSILLPFTGKLLQFSSSSASVTPPDTAASSFPTISRHENSPVPSPHSPTPVPSSDYCGDCKKPFSSQAKPTVCDRCKTTFHKTRCFKSHTCHNTTSVMKPQTTLPTKCNKREAELFTKLFSI